MAHIIALERKIIWNTMRFFDIWCNLFNEETYKICLIDIFCDYAMLRIMIWIIHEYVQMYINRWNNAHNKKDKRIQATNLDKNQHWMRYAGFLQKNSITKSLSE